MIKRFSLLLLVPVICIATSNLLAQVAVRAETIYTMSGEPIRNGVILIRDGKIERVRPAAAAVIPSQYRILTAKVVTPGLIDAHTVVGLAGYLNQPQDQDQLETSAAIQPELRAIDSYNSRKNWLNTCAASA